MQIKIFLSLLEIIKLILINKIYYYEYIKRLKLELQKSRK